MANWENVGKIQGEKGEKGDKGDKGERGERGLQGEKGQDAILDYDYDVTPDEGTSYIQFSSNQIIFYGTFILDEVQSNARFIRGMINLPKAVRNINNLGVSITTMSNGTSSNVSPSYLSSPYVRLRGSTELTIGMANNEKDFDNGDYIRAYFTVIGEIKEE